MISGFGKWSEKKKERAGHDGNPQTGNHSRLMSGGALRESIRL
jgi:hypothetical protein